MSDPIVDVSDPQGGETLRSLAGGARPPAVNGRFVNLDGTTPDKKGLALFHWFCSRIPDEARQAKTAFLDLFRRNKSWRPPYRPDEAAALDPNRPHLTWIGHSTFLLRIGGHWVLTDPVFGHPKWTIWRHVKSGLPPDVLPPIDVVTLSHDHYDHLDKPSLARLKGDPQIVASLQISRYLPHATEKDWWQSVERPGLRITLTPAHHWSMRGPFGRNRTLWGGFVFQSDGITIYFAGDTAQRPEVFQSIRQRFPRIDVAILPIGAYAPPWFMQAQHMDPEEAVTAFELLGARQLVPMHWGTFNLSSEPIREPVDRLRTCWANRGYSEDDLWIMNIGETRTSLSGDEEDKQTLAGCASIQVRPAPLANVHKAAVVAFAWSVDLSSDSDKQLSNSIGDAINTSKAIADLAQGAEAAQQPARSGYEALAKKLDESVHWTVLPLQEVTANRVYQQLNTATHQIGAEAALTGIMHPLQAARLTPAQRKELLKGLGVDALLIADMKIKVGGTSGFAMAGLGSITKYPQSAIALTACGEQDDEPMWQYKWAAGDKAKTGVTNTMGAQNDSTKEAALAEATASGLDKLMARYREQSGPTASK